MDKSFFQSAGFRRKRAICSLARASGINWHTRCVCSWAWIPGTRAV